MGTRLRRSLHALPVVAVVLASTSLAWTAPPSDPSILSRRMVEWLGKGNVTQVVELLTDEAVESLAGAPAAAEDLAHAAAVHARIIAKSAPADAKAVATQLVALAKAVRAKGDANTEVPDRIQAYATTTHVRVATVAGETTTWAEWSEAIDLFTGLYAKSPGDGQQLALAADLLIEWAVVAGAEGEPQVLKAQTLVAEGRKALPTSVALRLEGAWVDVHSGLWGLGLKKAPAKGWLARGLETLAAATADFEKDPLAVREYHAAITAARELGVSTKAEYLTKPQTSAGKFTFVLPRDGTWVLEGGDGDKLIFSTTRSYGQGATLTLMVTEYSWDTNYTTDEGKVGGDNTKGLMEQDRKALVAKLSKVEKQEKLLKGRLNRAIADSTGFDVRGTEGEGAAHRERVWYFKSDYHPVSYCLTLQELGPLPVKNSERDLVIASLAEIPSKTK